VSPHTLKEIQMKLTTYATITRVGLMVSLLTLGNVNALASRVALRAGTVLPVRLDSNLSSDNSMRGDTFTATVRSGYYGLPEGTKVDGVVRRVSPRTSNKAGFLVLGFTAIVLPNGRRTIIDGSPVNLDSKSVTTSANGRMVAKSGAKNQRLTYVGYGAGAGALVSVIDGGRNFLKDTAIGAGLGYLGGALEKGRSTQKNNVLLKGGTSLGVLLHQSKTIRV
jgi:hypothetical protein